MDNVKEMTEMTEKIKLLVLREILNKRVVELESNKRILSKQNMLLRRKANRIKNNGGLSESTES